MLSPNERKLSGDGGRRVKETEEGGPGDGPDLGLDPALV